MIYSIPAIDLLNEKVVRLYQGNYENVTYYSDNPMQVAEQISGLGFSNIHIIDLMGAKTGDFTSFLLLEYILDLGLSVQVGGGIRTLKHAKKLIEKGVDRVIVSTKALVCQSFLSRLIKSIGAKRVILSLDICNGFPVIHGWKQYSNKTVHTVLQSYHSLNNLIVTDVIRDGTLSCRINHNLYSSILMDFPNINLIAAGGISSVDSIKELDKIGCTACIIGKAYYEINGFKEAVVAKAFHRRM